MIDIDVLLQKEAMERQHQLEMEKVSLAKELTTSKLKADENQSKIYKYHNRVQFLYHNNLIN